MSPLHFDLLSSLHSASAEVDDLCRRARKVQEQAQRLEEPQKQSMPTLTGRWSKAALTAHIEMLQEWIRDPVRSRNRQSLQQVGVNTHSLPEEFFDETERAEAFADQVRAVTERFEPLQQFLVSDEALPTWIRSGFDQADTNLTEVVNNVPRYERLWTSNNPEALKRYLIFFGVSQPGKIAEAEEISRQAETVSNFGITLSVHEEIEDVEMLCGMLASLSGLIVTLSENFPEESASLQDSISSESMERAKEIIEEKVRQCEEERTALLSQWHDLRNSLSLLGENIESSPPQTLPSLRVSVEKLRNESNSKLGAEGIALLGFLREQRDFPSELSNEAIERALISLRPLILRAIKEESHDA
ncbi:MAG: hypothetical protein WD648_11700 [Planctomycetaceae bacterium]